MDGKRPSFQFYPGDWLRSTDLRACSVGARGLWIDMLCLMHEGSPYGYLRVNNLVITPPLLSRMVGGVIFEVEIWLKELKESGVLSFSDDNCMFSRRMIKDEYARNSRIINGEKGREYGHLGGKHGKKGGRPKKITPYIPPLKTPIKPPPSARQMKMKMKMK